jgi:hypothetical protein
VALQTGVRDYQTTPNCGTCLFSLMHVLYEFSFVASLDAFDPQSFLESIEVVKDASLGRPRGLPPPVGQDGAWEKWVSDSVRASVSLKLLPLHLRVLTFCFHSKAYFDSWSFKALELGIRFEPELIAVAREVSKLNEERGNYWVARQAVAEDENESRMLQEDAEREAACDAERIRCEAAEWLRVGEEVCEEAERALEEAAEQYMLDQATTETREAEDGSQNEGENEHSASVDVGDEGGVVAAARYGAWLVCS